MTLQAKDRPAGFETSLKKKISLSDGKDVEVDFLRLAFPRTEQSIKNSYGGKNLVSYKGDVMFAELAIRRKLIDAGWSAQWISGNYYLEKWIDEPFTKQEKKPLQELPCWNLLSQIDKQCVKLFSGHIPNSCDGCWDVVAWKDDRILFVESKHKDTITPSQEKWLAAALSAGLNLDDFIVVKWQYE
ncbi:hypothetical protein [Candidatus Nitrososphaera sp. FF02]|uniref:hypothetical protein n=1 Tax=Candidatus Nitrososphaera sp. FF02 TaxID=3398226 RepID=UPI0039E7BF06